MRKLVLQGFRVAVLSFSQHRDAQPPRLRCPYGDMTDTLAARCDDDRVIFAAESDEQELLDSRR